MMRKRIIKHQVQSHTQEEEEWLDLERLAEVEVTSEDASHPVELALLAGGEPGWRARDSGEQRLRLLFDDPQQVSRIRLVVTETEKARTQEFSLGWSAGVGQNFREIVRQQWTFSPSGSTREVEDYEVNLSGVKILELKIVPDTSGAGDARASVEQLRLA